MMVKDDIVGLLWTTLRSLDASTDSRRKSPVVLQLERQMLSAIAQLEAARPKVIKLKRVEQDPDGAA